MPVRIASTSTPFPEAARDRLQFDIQSLEALMSGAVDDQIRWAADPAGYVVADRVLRDAESPRLLATVTGQAHLFATDGCNTCRYALPDSLDRMTADSVERLAGEKGIPPRLLHLLRSAASDASAHHASDTTPPECSSNTLD